ncbi:putative epoxide hydrolase [Colletotrichum shisoi]|uniref:Putative epoxide hydrolase n=1 Tax=Colletotrichum shisoi TaxID=2078593 RepID=A0A5Q4BQJ5_9PEZI|nr:putative epoxide hydrolase [Colletotrichum shisoi]
MLTPESPYQILDQENLTQAEVELVQRMIGEKFAEWPDSRCPLPLHTALPLVGFYWYTNTYPRSLYLYHYVAEAAASDVLFAVPTSREKPFGYSVFPAENILVPEAWARQV